MWKSTVHYKFKFSKIFIIGMNIKIIDCIYIYNLALISLLIVKDYNCA